jgi:acyl dehydratase
MQQLFLEDFQPGQVFPSVSKTLTDSHFMFFSAITGDAHPIHYDEEYARSHGWKGRVAHGLLLASICALGAAPISHALSAAMIAMVGTEVRYRGPAYIGDTLLPEFSVQAVEHKGEARGILHLTISLRNQRHELVLDGTHHIMLKRRTLAADPHGAPR